MNEIPQRVLRNESGAILRRANAGETFVVTVHGRPMAVLGPYEPRQWVSAERFREILATPTDPTVLDDLRSLDEDDLGDDPWTR
jgi:prevent-host-death family protein